MAAALPDLTWLTRTCKKVLHGLDDPNVGTRRAISEWPGDNGNSPYFFVLDDANNQGILFGSSAPMLAEATIDSTSGTLSTNFKWFRADHDAGRQERKGTRELWKAGQDFAIQLRRYKAPAEI